MNLILESAMINNAQIHQTHFLALFAVFNGIISRIYWLLKLDAKKDEPLVSPIAANEEIGGMNYVASIVEKIERVNTCVEKINIKKKRKVDSVVINCESSSEDEIITFSYKKTKL
ncbi:hypothetical protein ROZALSC1DRAFT_29609 [Rozella allomycis CSF55]|uniref:Uncharacterized protein n=1 Tax=Rozella allomycis (strain CSF55) TaxID=988480 RepID=A0A4P9YIT9_ROZAC|nr:hypothetical protein ROZALSC1DRAFT_29609 [Rozella allomycis CSF55]